MEPGKKEEEEDKLETFFCQLYEFHNPPVSVPVFIPADLPPRYAISFVPAVPVDNAAVPSASAHISAPVSVPPVIAASSVVPSASAHVSAPISVPPVIAASSCCCVD